MRELYYTSQEIKVFITDGENEYRVLENFDGLSIKVWTVNSPSYNSYWAEMGNKTVLDRIKRWYLSNRAAILIIGEIRS